MRHNAHVMLWLLTVRYAQSNGKPCSYYTLPYIKQGCYHCEAFIGCHVKPGTESESVV